jgi:uncharacterized protein (TIGR02452 family)
MRMKRTAIANDTIEILEAGYYIAPSGDRINIEREISSCLDRTKYYDPDLLSNIQQEILASKPQFSTTEFELYNETTLTGIERTTKTQKFEKIGVLNFASAKNAGGGFLNGSQAQEESLARSSALYKSLLKCREYYEFHRSHTSLLYSDRIIYSPNCPVLKNDAGILFDRPYSVDFITSPAPNAGAIEKNQPQDMDKIEETLRIRGGKILSLATYNGCDALILGAWGCGVFRNNPATIAQMFANFLLPDGRFWGRFKSVVFSVLDTTKQQNIFAEFEKHFAR